MTGVVVVVAVVVFLAGLLVGVVAAGTVLLRREDRTHELGGRASSRLSRSAYGLVTSGKLLLGTAGDLLWVLVGGA